LGFLKKLKIEPPYDLAILPLGIYPREKKTEINSVCVSQINLYTPIFHATEFTTAKMWN
jgi:hypothetical protein